LHGANVPFVERYSFGDSYDCRKNLYGLGAGDTELLLNVIPMEDNGMKQHEEQVIVQSKRSGLLIVDKLISELQFEGMVGSKNEPLPRLQNLQADLPIIGKSTNNNSRPQATDNDGIILPVYRYPGNYSGTEWPTQPWSPTSLSIKHSVEHALRPLYSQHMNHCVSNLYRTGSDKIDHHSDKDLDLNREGVIVSVSLGCTRVMEVRDRRGARDVVRLDLPPGSMFVLGPFTNAMFTHAVLPMESDGFGGRGKQTSSCKKQVREVGSGNKSTDGIKCSIEGGGRISLTFRDVRTFLDVKTQRLFGLGVTSSHSSKALDIDLDNDGIMTEKSLTKAVLCIRQQDMNDRGSAMLIAFGMGATAGYAVSSKSRSDKSHICPAGGMGRASECTDTMPLLRSISTMAISASASYWYIRQARSKMRQQREEKEAREFFSKKSASGNKY